MLGSDAGASTSGFAPLVLAAVVALLVIAGVELCYRAVGGFPTVWPGWTQVEYQWRVQRAEPERSVFVLGDSRVGWGFAERPFDDEMDALGRPYLRAVNAALPASDVRFLVHHVVHRSGNDGAGVLVLHFSPGSFYVFQVGPGSVIEDLKLQDRFDDALTSWLGARLYTYGMGWSEIWKDVDPRAELDPGKIAFSGRTVFDDGFVNATSSRRDRAPLDPSDYQVDSYRAWYQGAWDVPFPDAMTASFGARRAVLVGQLREAQELGWTVVLTRFPTGPRMRALEERLPERWSPEALAAELGIPFLDYEGDPRAAGLRTQDESHLDPESARGMARLLARDLDELLPPELGRAP